MKKIDEDHYFEYYQDFFQGIEIMHRRNKFTGETMILFTDEMAQKMFGFESVERMMHDEKIQSHMQEFHRTTNEPLFRPSIDFKVNDVN